VPDSGRGAACGYRRRSNRDIDEGLIKLLRLRYFIASPERRVNIIKEKYGFVRSVFDGKQIILVDDSYVRGETSKEVVDTCRKYGAAGVDLRPSVLIRRPCVLGIDITRKGDLMAPRILKDDEQMSDEELFRRIAERTGADSFRSNTVADIEDIAGPNACTGCMGGTYAYQEEVEKLLQLNISDEIRPYEAQS
jgi:amidophosphoribosyltransferase